MKRVLKIEHFYRYYIFSPGRNLFRDWRGNWVPFVQAQDFLNYDKCEATALESEDLTLMILLLVATN